MFTLRRVDGTVNYVLDVDFTKLWLSVLIVCLLHDNYQLALGLGGMFILAYVREWCLEEIEKEIRHGR